MPRILPVAVVISLCCLFASSGIAFSEDLEHNGWRPYSPREEIQPAFKITSDGGMVIALDHREGQDGAWIKSFSINGDSHYRLTAYCVTGHVENERPQVYAEVQFLNSKGSLVLNKQTGVQSRPFYAPEVVSDRDGWTKFSGIFRAPEAATRADVQLHLRWAPGGRIEWSGVSLEKSDARTPRPVRLASANYRPKGGASAMDNLRQLEPHIAKAAELDADLLVLGECITSINNGLTHTDVAESVPGPSTKYLGELAKKYDLFLVTTIHERVDHLIYNTAVLLNPEGNLVGTYRKVCLARGEYRKGIAPGHEFPVFDTELGKIGMMICFDVHMPEVARGLAANGAEILALPIMGGHPALAKARAIENQVYLVTSTYSISDDWMQTGVWARSGDLLAQATEPNTVVVAEVDLAEQTIWRANMGDFQGRLRHERPSTPLPK